MGAESLDARVFLCVRVRIRGRFYNSMWVRRKQGKISSVWLRLILNKIKIGINTVQIDVLKKSFFIFIV